MKRGPCLGNMDNFHQSDGKFWNTAVNSWVEYIHVHLNIWCIIVYVCAPVTHINIQLQNDVKCTTLHDKSHISMLIARIALFRTSSSCIDVYTGEDSIHPGAESCCTIPGPSPISQVATDVTISHQDIIKTGKNDTTWTNWKHWTRYGFPEDNWRNGRTQILSGQCF